jgi:D-beta-D-heptose 7-phosphate kinase/D-beta-D-heptose 1-phosphate adenosyltransferase
MKTCVLVTGGFDPIHSGHIQYLKDASKLADTLVVGLNSDEWLTRKKGKPFMNYCERWSVVSNLSMVDEVIEFLDTDDTACTAIAQLLPHYDKIIFANGGDRSSGVSTPEYQYYQNNSKVEFVWGVGGVAKLNSSSWLLESWQLKRQGRPWGFWRVMHEAGDYKVKELAIKPKHSLSDQRHQYRNEHWYVLEGEVEIQIENDTMMNIVKLSKNMSYIIPAGTWHKAKNATDKPAYILEVQYGGECSEEDIERR